MRTLNWRTLASMRPSQNVFYLREDMRTRVAGVDQGDCDCPFNRRSYKVGQMTINAKVHTKDSSKRIMSGHSYRKLQRD